MKNKVSETHHQPNVDETVEKLGNGPDFRVKSYQGYDINGYTFYTKNQDDKSVMQNSGVTLIASALEFNGMDHNARGKRGAAKCNKMLKDPKSCTIDFNKNGLAIGKNKDEFKTWIGIAFRSMVPYHLVAKDIDKKIYDKVWDYIKISWKIPNDNAKGTVLKEGKAMMRSFRHTLLKKYVKKNKTPFEDYEYLKKRHWESFVATASSDEFEVKSKKAKISVAQNTDPACLGRGGFVKLEEVWVDRWNQLVSSYPYLAHMQDERSKKYTVSRARYNPITEKFELGAHLLSEGVLTGRLDELHKKEIEMKKNGSYYEHGKDVVTEVIGKGSQHGGRTRLVSHVVGVRKSLLSGKNKHKSKEAEVLTEEIDATQQDHDRIAAATERGLGRHASSGEPVRLYNDLPDIKSLSGCYLLLEDDDSVVARGRVYPTSERIIHGRPIANGFVKVHVDYVFDNYCSSDVPLGTQTDELNKVGDAKGQFIQWPRKLIKIINTDSFGQSSINQPQNVSVPTSQSTHCVNDEQPQPQHTLSPAYRPQYDETYSYQNQQANGFQDEGIFSRQESDINLMDMLTGSFPLQSTDVGHSLPQQVHHSHANASDPIIIRDNKIASLLTKIKQRKKSRSMHRLAEKLALLSNETLSIRMVSPRGMYVDFIFETIQIQSLLRLCLNKWVDADILSWFEM
ncbi:hypothetical protein SSX86_002333 [Deinandra increscens subsp. villosa]|uniref:DUF8039 domain-containing protein n=1 Tax=Deinandra increscens subsp. villosa TaxID=3103831 RepID=A0AAP0DNZ6_9ASTR